MPLTGKHLTVAAVLLALAGAAALIATLPGPGGSSPGNGPATATLSEGERNDVRTVVRDYLIDNPGVIIEALERMQAREHASERDRTRQAIAANRDALFANPADPAVGPADASVTIVEFFDYQCPYCKRMTGGMMALAAMDPDLRVVFKEFPILSPESEIAARAALAADRQGKYSAFHVALMQTSGKPGMAAIEAAAKTAEIDLDRLKADMQDPEIAAAIAANRRLAEELGINGTPAFIVGDQMIPGAVDPKRLADLVAQLRAETR